jgi:hypothetical protein
MGTLSLVCGGRGGVCSRHLCRNTRVGPSYNSHQWLGSLIRIIYSERLQNALHAISVATLRSVWVEPDTIVRGAYWEPFLLVLTSKYRISHCKLIPTPPYSFPTSLAPLRCWGRGFRSRKRGIQLTLKHRLPGNVGLSPLGLRWYSRPVISQHPPRALDHPSRSE